MNGWGQQWMWMGSMDEWMNGCKWMGSDHLNILILKELFLFLLDKWLLDCFFRIKKWI